MSSLSAQNDPRCPLSNLHWGHFSVNSLRGRAMHWQNTGHNFADDIFRYIFVNEKFCILIKISLKFVPKGLLDNKWAWVQLKAWRLTDDKPLPEWVWWPSSMTHICVTRSQWVKDTHDAAYVRLISIFRIFVFHISRVLTCDMLM